MHFLKGKLGCNQSLLWDLVAQSGTDDISKGKMSQSEFLFCLKIV